MQILPNSSESVTPAESTAAKTQILLATLRARTGLSRSSIYARLRQNPKRPGDYDPTFPKPISVGAKAVGWIEAEIDAWLTAQVEKSRKAASGKGGGDDDQH